MEKYPVCGMLVEPKQAAGQRTVEGQTYHFCSPGCLAKFEQAPERYIKQVPQPQKLPPLS